MDGLIQCAVLVDFYFGAFGTGSMSTVRASPIRPLVFTGQSPERTFGPYRKVDETCEQSCLMSRQYQVQRDEDTQHCDSK